MAIKHLVATSTLRGAAGAAGPETEQLLAHRIGVAFDCAVAPDAAGAALAHPRRFSGGFGVFQKSAGR